MARFRWRRHKGGKLYLKGRSPVPDPRDRRRIIAGCSPRMITFRRDGADGLYDTDDPWEIEGLRSSLPWKRGELGVDGAMPTAAVKGQVPLVGVAEGLALATRSPLPYFEEPETLDDLLAIF